ncbi:MAG: pilus assembly protein N-terminal domain-containing protein [Acidobacteria bacterium]|nr:pilus assembly protein N-terminal domain-containing protein [Acidobacteriota bacterium]
MRHGELFFEGLAALVLAAGGLSAQTLPARELSLITGRGELLQFEKDLQKVVISEPKIADAVVVSPREVMVNGKSPGKATLIVWETGATPGRWNITVADDTSDVERSKKELQSGLGEHIKVDLSGDTVVLTGTVKDADEAKRAAGLAGARAKNVVNLLQTPPPPEPRQILLQVRFASIDRVALGELGFNFFSRNDKQIGELTTQQFQSPRFSQLQFQNQTFSNATVNFADLLNLFAFRPDLNIGATIKAMQARNLLQILAEPNLITLEGKEASFLAGGSFPFPTLTTTSTGGATSPVITVQFRQFGVQLNFTPTVTTAGAIHLKVAPEVSSLDFANAVTLQGFLIPAIAQRRAETEVLLKDGESFAIAGLIDNRVIQTLTRVRGLGDLPIVGNLFRSRSTRKSNDELLVVVTPRFVRPLSPEEKAKLPDFQETFLPTVAEQKAKKKKKPVEPKAAEFTGAKGHQEPPAKK